MMATSYPYEVAIMKTIARYDLPELETLIAEATQEAGGDFTAAFVSGVAGELGADPLRYRAFGPYWWLVKREIIDSGITFLGEELDSETLAALDYVDSKLNLAAAYAWRENTLATSALYSDTHVVELTTGEVDQYVIYDHEVEVLAATLKALRGSNG